MKPPMTDEQGYEMQLKEAAHSYDLECGIKRGNDAFVVVAFGDLNADCLCAVIFKGRSLVEILQRIADKLDPDRRVDDKDFHARIKQLAEDFLASIQNRAPAPNLRTKKNS